MANASATANSGELKLIRKPEVLKRTGLGNTELYRRISANTFPRQIRLGVGARAVAWNSIEVEKWISDRIAERDAGGV